MTTLFKLNCPRCRKHMTQVPHGGLTLYYRCAEHGSVILRPLLLVDEEPDDEWQPPSEAPHAQYAHAR